MSRYLTWRTIRALPVLVTGAIIVVCAVEAFAFFVYMVNRTGGVLSAPIDDTFIYFQYARLLADGRLLEFNPGAGASSGSTSILYPLILAVGFKLGFSGASVIIYAFAVNALFFASSGVLMFRFISRLAGRNAALAGAILFVLNGPLIYAYLSMMETGLFTMLLLWLIESSQRRGVGDLKTMSLAALLPFARPEGAIVSGIVVCMAAWLYVKSVNRSSAQLLVVILPLATTALYFVGMGVVTGSFGSNTLHSKSVVYDPRFTSLEVVSWIITNTRDFLGVLASDVDFFLPATFYLALVGLLPLVVREAVSRTPASGVITVVALALILVSGSHVRNVGGVNLRYLLPSFPLLTAFAVVGLWHVAGSFGQATESKIFCAIVAVLLVFGVRGCRMWLIDFGSYSETVAKIYIGPALWINEHVPNDAVIAAHDVGALGYYGNRRVFDVVGLVSNGVAYYYRNGPGSLLELMLRLPDEERPTWFLLSHQWAASWAEARLLHEAATFSFPESRVWVLPKELNLFKADWSCGKPQQMLESEWSQGGTYTLTADVNVADLESEGEYAYHLVFPKVDFARIGGITSDHSNVAVRGVYPNSGGCVFEGGRIVERKEDFELRATPGKPARIVARVLGPTDEMLKVVVSGRSVGSWHREVKEAGMWEEIAFDISPTFISSDRVAISLLPDPGSGTASYKSFHYWVFQPIP